MKAKWINNYLCKNVDLFRRTDDSQDLGADNDARQEKTDSRGDSELVTEEQEGNGKADDQQNVSENW